MVIFGDGMQPASTTYPSDWIAPARRTARPGTVGSLVPDSFAAMCRVHPPPPSPDDWWSAYRDLFVAVAEVAARHTARPDLAWFAIWEGHGFDTATTHVAWRDPPSGEAERRARAAYRIQVGLEGERRNAAIRAALAEVPRFELPHRRYYLLEGPVAAVAGLRDPASDHWRNPDLLWPDDRRWFVATDVDIWSVYVGGPESFVTELAGALPAATERVSSDDRLPMED